MAFCSQLQHTKCTHKHTNLSPTYLAAPKSPRCRRPGLSRPAAKDVQMQSVNIYIYISECTCVHNTKLTITNMAVHNARRHPLHKSVRRRWRFLLFQVLLVLATFRHFQFLASGPKLHHSWIQHFCNPKCLEHSTHHHSKKLNVLFSP